MLATEDRQLAYPPVPWVLKGRALQTVNLVDTKQARPLVHSDLQVVSVLPGKTLGVVYFASYMAGSVLEYNELIVAAALTRFKGRVGFWISHIYVDDARSMAGGRELWGLPKELAQFRWEEAPSGRGRIAVRQGEQVLCRLEYGKRGALWRQPLLLPVLSVLGSDVLSFSANLKGRLGISSSRLSVPAGSPLACIGLAHRKLTLHCRNMRLVAGAPAVVGPLPHSGEAIVGSAEGHP